MASWDESSSMVVVAYRPIASRIFWELFWAPFWELFWEPRAVDLTIPEFGLTII